MALKKSKSKSATVTKKIPQEFIPGEYFLTTDAGHLNGPMNVKTVRALEKLILDNSRGSYPVTRVYRVASSSRIESRFDFYTEVEVPAESPEGFIPQEEMRTAEV